VRPARIAPLAVVLAVGGLVPGAPSAGGATFLTEPPPSYYRPVILDGMTFPVARSNWLSVIELAPDWHDPRFRLIDGRWQLVGVHEGNDIVAEEGTPVVSASAGTIEAVGWTFYSGTRVGVRGADGNYYFYAHLSRVARAIRVGVAVEAGDVLGLVGNTGYGPPGHQDEFPPHLHFGIEAPGGWEDPYPLVLRLYRASVRTTTRGESQLAALGRAGEAGAVEELEGRLYADLMAAAGSG
jgi:murein DD-endopeptidase MepM/ murein hydrolase activator NlpD